MRTITQNRPTTASWTVVCALSALAVEALRIVGG